MKAIINIQIHQTFKKADIYLSRRLIARSIGSHIGISFLKIISGGFTCTLYASLCTALQNRAYMYSLNSLHDCQLTFSSEQYPYRLRYYYFSNYSYQQRLFLNPIRKKIYPKKANLELLLKQNYNYKKLILYKNWFAIYFRNKNHNLESIAYYLFDIIYGIKVLRTWRKHLDSKFCINPI